MDPGEYQALEAACRGRCITAPELVRLVAVRLARAVKLSTAFSTDLTRSERT